MQLGSLFGKNWGGGAGFLSVCHALDSRNDGANHGLSVDYRLSLRAVLYLPVHLTPRAPDAEAGDQDVFTQTALKQQQQQQQHTLKLQ